MSEPEQQQRRSKNAKRARGSYVFAVDHPSLEPFGPVIRSVVRIAFTGGLQALASAGRTMDAIRVDPRARNRFLRGCHRGYDKAQERIGALVLQIHDDVDATEAQAAGFRRDKDLRSTEVETRAVVLRNRQLALRRVADALLCAITQLETWILKRLILDHRIRDIDPSVVRRMLALARRRNGQTRARFSLVADLTTTVQIGDLVEISFDRSKPRWRVIEVKEGRVNELLSEALAQNASSGLADASVYDKIEDALGKGAARQARRMRLQITRLAEVEKIITTDTGLDPALNEPLFMLPDKVVTDSYDGAVRRVTEEGAPRVLVG